MMRYFIFPVLFIFFCISANGQNFYVAVVHGQVFYEGKILQKRDKITLGNEIRFTSNEDYVKLSGPGGLYKLQPEVNSAGDYEFFIALRNELFPQLRQHATVEYSEVIESCSGCYFLPYKYGLFTFFEQHAFSRAIPALDEGEEIGYLHQTTNGLYYRTARLVDSFLVIRKKDFRLKKVNGLRPTIENTFIVHVYRKNDFLALLGNYDSLDDIAINFDLFGSKLESVSFPVLDEDGNEIPVEVVSNSAMIMDRIRPPRFIKRKDMIKDLKFHVKLSDPINVGEFLFNFKYDSYLLETFGELHFIDMDEIWLELKLLKPNERSVVLPIN